MKTILLSLSVFSSLALFAQTGIVWGPSGDVANSTFGNDYPRVVMDGSGNPVVSWGGGNKMMFARWNGTSFTTPDTLSESGVDIAHASWQGPEIASHGDTIYAVYKQTPENLSSSGVWCVSSVDGGMNFGSPVLVNAFTVDSMTRFPAITTDENGHPITAFMKFNPDFSNARWVVTRSNDYGATFGQDVKASGWSSPTSEVCDCCPGTITSNGSTVIMMYRDNNSNVRDSWAGISTDGGNSFTSGMNIDQKNWVLNSCPSSGPDGFILGDTLYATFMNGQSGDYEVFYSSSHFPSSTGGAGIPLDPVTAGDIQNYPRTANSGSNAAYAWRENSNGSTKILLRYTSNINGGLIATVDTIAYDYGVSCDVTMSSTQVVVVWKDFNSGTVKYRMGTIPGVGSIESQELDVEVYPNPSTNSWKITGNLIPGQMYNVLDVNGRVVFSGTVQSTGTLLIDASEFMAGIYFLRTETGYKKLIKE
ncbi:MAG: T9SS type A sorting domain-containing protein [Crocinitomicaceae bacterium]|nr:T9SS type A sorting domain-containing protein [Crocinitomicaceae bacterium]